MPKKLRYRRILMLICALLLTASDLAPVENANNPAFEPSLRLSHNAQ